jgi:hypothetical protein
VGRGAHGLPADLDGTRWAAAWADGSWEHGLPRTARGVPDRAARLKALGNAVVPAVAEHVARCVLAADAR